MASTSAPLCSSPSVGVLRRWPSTSQRLCAWEVTAGQRSAVVTALRPLDVPCTARGWCPGVCRSSWGSLDACGYKVGVHRKDYSWAAQTPSCIIHGLSWCWGSWGFLSPVALWQGRALLLRFFNPSPWGTAS